MNVYSLAIFIEFFKGIFAKHSGVVVMSYLHLAKHIEFFNDIYSLKFKGIYLPHQHGTGPVLNKPIFFLFRPLKILKNQNKIHKNI